MSEKLRAALVGLLAVALVGCTAPTTPTPVPPTPATSSTIGLSYIPNVQFAPFYLAADEDALGGAQLRHHGANEGLFTAIAAGQEQYLIAGGDEALQAREQGIDLVAIATYYRTYPVRIIVGEESGITALPDLAGKKIGVPGRYGESWFGLLVALGNAGLTESDVDVVEVGYTQQAAMVSGKVDAVVGFANNDVVQFGLAGVKVRTLPLTTSGEPPLVSISLLTTAEHLAAAPQEAATVAKGMVAGIRATAADPERAITLTAEQVPGLDTTAARATLSATLDVLGGAEADGLVDPEQWQRMADFMLQHELIGSPVEVSAAIAPQVLG